MPGNIPETGPAAGHCPDCGAELPSGLPQGLCSRCALQGALVLEGEPAIHSATCRTCHAEAPAANLVNGLCTNCLLAAMRQLKRDAVDGPVPAPSPEPGSLRAVVGERIGRYKILQQIGEGGCGVVFLAEQAEPIRRKVALKVIKLGMDTKSVIARFEAERQALALMDHPNIARVLDAGATETGRPYFVMELVRGVKLTDYCDQQRLSTRARLELFVQVCHAVQHAHQKGIIHRDLKPSNILVTLHDGVPVPKVIDFGIAKATSGQHLTNQTLFTALEQFVGTPAYMSPEQAEMRSLDIDTRSDIYSLGVLLYELLTGRTPFDADALLAAGVEGMRRTIRERDPLKPSTRVDTLAGAEQATVADCRQTEPGKLARRLRGDLDWIVMKAMEKDRAQRYETANGLALDLLRHLHDEPIRARPVGQIERIRRWCRRKPLAASFVATLALALASSIGLLIRVNHEKNKQVLLVEQLRESERANNVLLNRTIGMIQDNLESMWESRDRRPMLLSAEDIAALEQVAPVPVTNQLTLTRLKMGLIVEESPAARLRLFAHALRELETQVGLTLGREVRVDVELYKFAEDFTADLCAGKVDFGRMAALPYLRARRTSTPPIPLAIPLVSSKPSLFFTRTNAGILSLGDIRGRRVAFGDTNATVSYRGQIRLLESGITAAVLDRYDFLDATLEFADEALEVGVSNALSRIGYLHSHAQVIESVLSGRYDVGVAREKAFRIHQARGLAAIPGSGFDSSRNLVVASPMLKPDLAAALIRAWTGLRGHWLEKLPDQSPGFQEFRPETYADEDRWLDRVTGAFPPKPSPPRVSVP